jgi:two-component system, NarL family, sensor kinase
LNNAVKHSKATLLSVELDYRADTLNLSIKDNGVGFDPAELKASETGIGLKNIDNRAALIGAVVTIDSSPGIGTAIIISLPCE